MTPTLMKFLGTLINIVGLLSPEIAGRLAFAVFSRTRSRKPKSAKEAEMLATSAALMDEATREVLHLPEGDAVVHVFAPTAAPTGEKVFVTHGWGSHAGFVPGLIAGLRATGATLYVLDLPGHGHSSGRKITPPMAVHAIAAADQRFGPFDVMTAHSFGGYMSVIAVSGALDGTPVVKPGKLVIIAAPADVRVVLGHFGGMLGLSDRVQKALVGQIERLSGRAADAFLGPDLLAKSGVETLVLHAEDDKEVGARAARQYGEAGEHVRLVWLNGFGHRRIVNSQEAIDAIAEFAELGRREAA